MEFRHLRYFVAVAEELHFSRAAVRLNISQPPLSQQIAALEHELRFKLFYRDKHTVELTKAGRAFLEHARAILAETEAAVLSARRVDQGYEGKLIVGFMSALMLDFLSVYVAAFRKSLPSAEAELRQMRSDEQYMAVVNGDIDAGFVDIALGDMLPFVEGAAVDIRHALRVPLMLGVTPEHPLADRESVSFQELQDEPFIALNQHGYPATFEALQRLCANAGFRPRLLQQVESTPVAIALAGAGYGVTLVPHYSDRPALSCNARLVPIEEKPFGDIFLISRANDHGPLLARLRQICTLPREQTKCT